MQLIVKENLVKNAVLLVILAVLYPSVQMAILQRPLSSDKGVASAALIAVSMVSVIACFGNFAFTYEKISRKSVFQRWLAHATTGLLMFVIGMTLIMASMLLHALGGGFFFFDAVLAVLYVANIGYDFWDVFRHHYR